VSRDRRHRHRGMGSRLNGEGTRPCQPTIWRPGGPPPSGRGAYLLLIHIDKPVTVVAGGLGTLTLEPGVYVYVGSARGPGGLAARLARHERRMRGRAPAHWHVDYILPYAARLEGVVVESPWPGLEECLARECSVRLEWGPRGFGSSDSRVETHLYRCPGGCRRLLEECVEACCLPAEAPLDGPG